VVDIPHPSLFTTRFLLDAGKPACLLKCFTPLCPTFFSPPYLSPVEEYVVGQYSKLYNAEVDPDYAARLVEPCFLDEGYGCVPLAAFVSPYLHRPLTAGTSCQILEPVGVVCGSGKGYGYLAPAGGDRELDDPCA